MGGKEGDGGREGEREKKGGREGGRVIEWGEGMREMEGGGRRVGREGGRRVLLVGGREGGSNDEGEGVRVGVHELY